MFVFLLIIYPRAEDTPQPSNLLCSKNKKGKKEKASKQKLLKGCHQGQNVTVKAILERLEFKTFFFGGQTRWPAILFSVPWPVHFETNFAGPAIA